MEQRRTQTRDAYNRPHHIPVDESFGSNQRSKHSHDRQDSHGDEQSPFVSGKRGEICATLRPQPAHAKNSAEQHRSAECDGVLRDVVPVESDNFAERRFRMIVANELALRFEKRDMRNEHQRDCCKCRKHPNVKFFRLKPTHCLRRN
jgi:hypothetical protein